METKPFQSNRSSYPTSSTRKQTILSLAVLPCLSTPNASSTQSQNHCEELSHLFLRSSAPQAIIDITSLTCDSENSKNVGGTTNSRPRTAASLWMVAAITSIWVFSTKVAITRNVHLQFYWLQQEKRLIYSRKDKTNVYPKGKKDISPQKIWKLETHWQPVILAQSTNCIPPYTLLAKRTPTVNAREAAGTRLATGDASTKRSSPLIIW